MFSGLSIVLGIDSSSMYNLEGALVRVSVHKRAAGGQETLVGLAASQAWDVYPRAKALLAALALTCV